MPDATLNDPVAIPKPGRRSEVCPTDETERIEALSVRLTALEKQIGNFSWLRLATFLAVVVGLISWAKSPIYPLIVALPALCGFVGVVVLDNRIRANRRLLDIRRTLLQERLGRRQSRKRTLQAPSLLADSKLALERGESLIQEPSDAFRIDEGLSSDLELFEGPRPVYGFLDLTNTIMGARRLRNLLTHPLTSVKGIMARQHAVSDLAKDHVGREKLLEALAPLREHSFETTPTFLRSEPQFPRVSAAAIVSNIFGTIVPILVILALTVDALTFLPFIFLVVFLNVCIIAYFVKRTNVARNRVLLFGPLLDALDLLDRHFALSSYSSRELANISSALGELRPINRKMRGYIRLLEIHGHGMMFEVFNVLTLWELRFVPFAERLLHRRRELLENSIGALAEIEALISLASPLAEHASFCLPTPNPEEAPRVSATALGHPLIDDDKVVRNDFEIGEPVNVMIVTGSNMAGKSTFLKSVALNLLLASVGGPVSARRFSFTPVALYSDLNVRDSLDDGKSYFQVEVERVHEVIRKSASSRRILAIFDELFRGTNSDERLALCRSILRHLSKSGMLLIVATHDNAVTTLVSEEGEKGMANYHFEEQVNEGQMSFDYRLRKGPARTRNAIRVLETSGYPREIVDQARSEAGYIVKG